MAEFIPFPGDDPAREIERLYAQLSPGDRASVAKAVGILLNLQRIPPEYRRLVLALLDDVAALPAGVQKDFLEATHRLLPADDERDARPARGTER